MSAYITAARSVLWIMRAEFQHLPGWEEWYAGAQVEPEEKALLSPMNDLRVRSQKSHPVATGLSVVFSVPPENVTPQVKEALLASDTRQRFQLLLYPVDAEGGAEKVKQLHPDAFMVVTEAVERRLDQFPDDDAVEVCHRYLRFLERIVGECFKDALKKRPIFKSHGC
jgi:hypothetical protein